MVLREGLEPPNYRFVDGCCSSSASGAFGQCKRTRTFGLRSPSAALYQLSYTLTIEMAGTHASTQITGPELTTVITIFDWGLRDFLRSLLKPRRVSTTTHPINSVDLVACYDQKYTSFVLSILFLGSRQQKIKFDLT